MRDSKTESKQTKGEIKMETEGKDTDFTYNVFIIIIIICF
jgi:hypothetical protein